MLENEIEGIDLLFVNFYPFERVLEKHANNFERIIENIDIGGPAMVRSAAKNFSSVGVVVDTSDYELIVEQLDKNSEKSLETRLYLAKKLSLIFLDMMRRSLIFFHLPIGEERLSKKFRNDHLATCRWFDNEIRRKSSSRSMFLY